MKRYFFLLFLLITNCFANGIVHFCSKIMPNVNGKLGNISFVFKSKEYTAEAILSKASRQVGYNINTENNPQNISIAIVIPKITSGKYFFGSGESQSSMYISNTNYLLNEGYISVQVSGKKLSGNFKAKYYSSDGKGGYNKIASGEITGTFDQLIIP